ncbi:CpaF family protein [Proteiniclasticum sp. C24MP]|uniref:CpaF family protein n=1 Tax=Proteiniclasticum sp. C24MP TaxID=3374101 RepID=UPI003754F4A3
MSLGSFSMNRDNIVKFSEDHAAKEFKAKRRMEMEETIKTVLDNVIQQMSVNMKSPDMSKKKEVSLQVTEITGEVIEKSGRSFSFIDKQNIVKTVMDEIYELGPITPLLEDDDISEVMVNGPDNIYIEKKGKLVKSEVSFRDDAHVLHVIQRIIEPIGRRVDEKSPMVDARLQDGSRVNIIVPPLALNGPTITIRKFAADPFTLEDLISFGTLNMDMATYLKASVKGRTNIIVSGGTGSGKTTFLNIMSSFIPHDERIVTIEDAAELQLQQDHVVKLETRPADIEGKGRIGIRELVVNSLRMRPDRIVVGEVRSAEALDMLQAMNTGHDGSLTTVHANTPRDSLSRLETMVMMAGMDLPSRAIREQIASAIHLIVQIGRFNDGSRKVMKITEVLGMEGQTVTLQDIFEFRHDGFDENGRVKGSHVATGIVPGNIENLNAHGEKLNTSIFRNQSFRGDSGFRR